MRKIHFGLISTCLIVLLAAFKSTEYNYNTRMCKPQRTIIVLPNVSLHCNIHINGINSLKIYVIIVGDFCAKFSYKNVMLNILTKYYTRMKPSWWNVCIIWNYCCFVATVILFLFYVQWWNVSLSCFRTMSNVSLRVWDLPRSPCIRSNLLAPPSSSFGSLQMSWNTFQSSLGDSHTCVTFWWITIFHLNKRFKIST